MDQCVNILIYSDFLFIYVLTQQPKSQLLNNYKIIIIIIIIITAITNS
jgi:hypothetical protein